jgi:membrane associated rhomboid family serine protease
MNRNNGYEDPEEQAPILQPWQPGEVWFGPWVPREQPWGDEEVLDPVPEIATGKYALILDASATINDHHYKEGETMVAESRSHFERILFQLRNARAVAFPWFGRLVPLSLLVPHAKPIDGERHRAAKRDQFFRGLSIVAALAAAAFFLPDFRFYALLLATMYGIHPMVEAAVTATESVDRYPVEDLNRRLVNDVFFAKWIAAQKSPLLKAGVVLLALIFAGQVFAGLGASFEAAALVKSRVRFQGEWWRLVTAGLMHGNFLHILFNGMAFHAFGKYITGLVYPPLLAFVFLFSVMTGSLASLYLGQAATSVGASGGILGCLGFLLVVTGKFQHVLPAYLRTSLMQNIIVIAIFGLLGSGYIDNAAHAGGFAGGIFLGILLDRSIHLGATTAGPVLKGLSITSIGVLVIAAAKVALELWRSLPAR